MLPNTTTSEWTTGLAECVAFKWISVLRDGGVMIYVDDRQLFHPVQALLSSVKPGNVQSNTSNPTWSCGCTRTLPHWLTRSKRSVSSSSHHNQVSL